MEFENVREALKFLLEYNDATLNPNLKSRVNGGEWSPSTVNEAQMANYDALAQAADMLGMSDLYLNEQPAQEVSQMEQLNVTIESLDELKKLLDEASDQVKQLQNTMSKITEYQMKFHQISHLEHKIQQLHLAFQ